jgi:hypothetical protein
MSKEANRKEEILMDEQQNETSETSIVPEEIGTKRWQIITLIFASVLGIALFIDFLSFVFTGVFSLLGFIVIPLVFAFPIIIGKYKLLLIPTGIFLLACTAVYITEYPDLIPFLVVVLGLIGGLGAVAGGFVRWFRSAKGRKKLSYVIVGTLIALLPVLFVSSFLFGRPVVSLFINRKVQAHVVEHYYDFDLIVGRTWWDFKNDDYNTRVYYRNNNEFYFMIRYTNQRGIMDEYTRGDFWAKQLRVTYLPYMEEHFGDELRFFHVSVNGLQVGEMPSQGTSLDVLAWVNFIIESPDPITIAEKFLHSQEILQQSEIPFTAYRIEFFLPNGRARRPIAYVYLHTRHIDENLPVLIKYLQDNLDENGHYIDRERGMVYRANDDE